MIPITKFTYFSKLERGIIARRIKLNKITQTTVIVKELI